MCPPCCWTTHSSRRRHAFVASRLDYCNSLYAYSSVSTRQRLQRVQNSAARVVPDAPHRASSRPLLHQLHWLPVEDAFVFSKTTPLKQLRAAEEQMSNHYMSTDLVLTSEWNYFNGLQDVNQSATGEQRCTVGTQIQRRRMIPALRRHCRVQAHLHRQSRQYTANSIHALFYVLRPISSMQPQYTSYSCMMV